jgi:hypothetical protein
MGTAFLRGLARQDAIKAALRRRRLAKLVLQLDRRRHRDRPDDYGPRPGSDRVIKIKLNRFVWDTYDNLSKFDALRRHAEDFVLPLGETFT